MSTLTVHWVDTRGICVGSFAICITSCETGRDLIDAFERQVRLTLSGVQELTRTTAAVGQCEEEAPVPLVYLIGFLDKATMTITKFVNQYSDLERWYYIDKFIVIFSVSKLQLALEDDRKKATVALVHCDGITTLFPFLFIVHRNECWSRVRERLRRKMAVPARIFDVWVFRYNYNSRYNSITLDPLTVLYDKSHRGRGNQLFILHCNPPEKYCDYQALVIAEYVRAARSVHCAWPQAPVYVHEHLSNFVTIDTDVDQFLSFAQRMRIVNYVRQRPVVATSLLMLLRHVLIEK